VIDKVIKRDGRVVPFDREKIATAVYRAAVAMGGRDRETAQRVTDDVLALLEARQFAGTYPSV
jgi:anaerobic ribonucleoside-triphosphate reductase